MFFRRASQDEAVSTGSAHAFGDLHEWVLSLPWVVERPYSLATPGVRSFAVECGPLDRHQLWLVTGLVDTVSNGNPSITVIVPREAASDIEAAGWGRTMLPMPHGHVLMCVDGPAFDRRRDAEVLVLTAYSYAMS
jgi:hypothetical protein